MNFRLDVVVNDICGLTGLSIIALICKGENDPHKLAALRHGNCRKSEQEFQTYNEIQKKIEQCDKMISRFMTAFFKLNPELKKLKTHRGILN
ncbi:MAG: hypothetical protein HRT57_02910 [Crocinitomicaceae bacterium]|nr:hypothetical protein [Crocinitomicaceae bacterium]